MIIWDGQAIHEAIQRYLRTPQREAVQVDDRCVNEEAPGCAGRAEANGWCGPCWRTIVPDSPTPVVTEPFDTGCGRR